MTDSQLVQQHITKARQALRVLDFDADRTNERSALVLLALLGLTPEMEWRDSTQPMLRTVEIMAWIRNHFGRDYAANTRETIRRFTLHQFSDALLCSAEPRSAE